MPCATLAIATIIARASAERRRARHPTANGAAYLVAARPRAANLYGWRSHLVDSGDNLVQGSVYSSMHSCRGFHLAEWSVERDGRFIDDCRRLPLLFGGVTTANLVTGPTIFAFAFNMTCAMLAWITIIARSSADGRRPRHPAT